MSQKFNALVDAAEEMLPLLPWYGLSLIYLYLHISSYVHVSACICIFDGNGNVVLLPLLPWYDPSFDGNGTWVLLLLD